MPSSAKQHSFLGRALTGLACLGLAAATLAGCGTKDDEASSDPDTSDSEADYTALREAAKVFDCTSAFGDLDAAHIANDVAGQRAAAAEYRKIIAAWDEKVRAIDFPDGSREAAERLYRTNTDELNSLDDMAAATDANEATIVVWEIFVADWENTVANDELQASLGHPSAPALVAAHQLGLARSKSASASAEAGQPFRDALASGDLDAAIAANEIEIGGLETYLDEIDAIEFPDSVDSQVEQLKKDVQAQIDYDHQQVAVATTADIVESPSDGSAEAKTEAQTHEELQNTLNDMAPPSGPDPVCPSETGTPN